MISSECVYECTRRGAAGLRGSLKIDKYLMRKGYALRRGAQIPTNIVAKRRLPADRCLRQPSSHPRIRHRITKRVVGLRQVLALTKRRVLLELSPISPLDERRRSRCTAADPDRSSHTLTRPSLPHETSVSRSVPTKMGTDRIADIASPCPAS